MPFKFLGWYLCYIDGRFFNVLYNIQKQLLTLHHVSFGLIEMLPDNFLSRRSSSALSVDTKIWMCGRH